jgi:phasin family protein
MSLSRENVEALIASGNAAAKGVEEINAEVLAYNKVAFEDSMAAAKAVMSAKSVQDAFDLQTEWVKASFDSYMAQATKVGEMAAKASQAAFQPMNDRVAVMVEKAIKPVSL